MASSQPPRTAFAAMKRAAESAGTSYQRMRSQQAMTLPRAREKVPEMVKTEGKRKGAFEIDKIKLTKLPETRPDESVFRWTDPPISSKTPGALGVEKPERQVNVPVREAPVPPGYPQASDLPHASAPPEILPRTHGVHVATFHLQVYGYGRPQADMLFNAAFAMRAAFALGIPVTRPTFSKKKKTLITVPKGPFVHKKSMENFERRTYKSSIKAYDANPDTINLWLKFLQLNAVEGVETRVELFHHRPVGYGKAMLDAVNADLEEEEARAKGRHAIDAALKGEKVAGALELTPETASSEGTSAATKELKETSRPSSVAKEAEAKGEVATEKQS